ncbi:MAG: glycosyltransferase family 4 protein [Nitrososphaerota archaeon]|jgi:glycosyltransferase involved in cell wall biosynthesis|nr:glycosyltransferase family 4 protein [Nitrososphaerota archaeon]
MPNHSLFVIQQRFVLGRGSENAIFNYLRCLNGFRRTLVTGSISHNDQLILASAGIRTRIVKCHDSIGFPLSVLLDSVMHESEVLDVNLSMFPCLDFPIYAFKDPSRIIYTLHGGVSRIEAVGSSRPVSDLGFGLVSDIQKKLISRTIGGFAAISDYMYKEIQRLYNPRQIFRIPNSIDTDYFVPTPKPEGNLRPAMLFVGGLYPRKGIHLLVKEMPRILRKYPDASLTVVGGGPLHDYLNQMSHKCGVRDRICFLDGISNDRLRELYWASDIFITASLWESFCLPVYESLACGIPAIVRDSSALSELVDDPYSGVLGFKDEPEIVDRVSDCLEHYRQLRMFGRRFAERFSPERIAMLREKCYMKILNG